MLDQFFAAFPFPVGKKTFDGIDCQRVILNLASTLSGPEFGADTTSSYCKGIICLNVHQGSGIFTFSGVSKILWDINLGWTALSAWRQALGVLIPVKYFSRLAHQTDDTFWAGSNAGSTTDTSLHLENWQSGSGAHLIAPNLHAFLHDPNPRQPFSQRMKP